MPKAVTKATTTRRKTALAANVVRFEPVPQVKGEAPPNSPLPAPGPWPLEARWNKHGVTGTDADQKAILLQLMRDVADILGVQMVAPLPSRQQLRSAAVVDISAWKGARA